MIKIRTVYIARYRSIMNLALDIDTTNNFITLCGENNTGKTNTLRAIDLFFNPDTFIPERDTPHHKYYGSRGGAVYPEISITFNDDNKELYTITRKFKTDGSFETSGKTKDIVTKAKTDMNLDDINKFINKIAFFFVESINVSFPKLINNLIDDLYDLEFEKSRFSGLKGNLKDMFDSYIQGLLNILNELAEKEINPMFREYKENWGIKFGFEADIRKFRDIITDDISFYIDDKSNKLIESKGSGLQRLGYLLLYFRIIDKIKTKSVIFLIDEPDIYLHQGLQKQLRKHLNELSQKHQIFITTHSPIFIDSYTLNNVFLLDLEITPKEYVRTGKVFYELDTTLVDISQVDGARKIKEYLGIEDIDFDLLDSYNIIVEGESDKTYLEELSSYFHIAVPHIISANGAQNIPKFLEFYDSFYKGKGNAPKILAIFDNDHEGRDVLRKLSGKSYSNIILKTVFIPNFIGEVTDIDTASKNQTNHEIEDFLYPALLCELTNQILLKKGLNRVDCDNICTKIKQPSHKNNGILFLLENEKNNMNPERGIEIKINSDGFKNGLAGKFRIEGNKKLIIILQKMDIEYPDIKLFIRSISEQTIMDKVNDNRLF